MRLWLAIGLSALLTACRTEIGPGFPDDAATMSGTDVTQDDAEAAPADGPFPCGPQPGLTCQPTQYCLVGCTSEGPILCVARLDGGACPSGSVLAPRVCGSDATPCEENDFSSFPTECFDDLDASPCGYPDPAAALEGRTIYCACTL